jgi:NAD(P)-dependent dehydrogenase (short-subunit alcohol dehydrogenase family)
LVLHLLRAGVEADMVQAVVKLGRFDIVHSGAAGDFVAPALAMSANGFKTVVDINLMGAFHVQRASIQFLNRPGASLNSITAAQAIKPSVFRPTSAPPKTGSTC